MRPINNAVDELFQPRELAEDEYLNEADGLMYCSKCHTPRPVSYTHLTLPTNSRV